MKIVKFVNQKPVTVKTIDSSQLTNECWSIQMFGLKACDSRPCELKNTNECGGKRIRELIKNGKYSITGLKDTRKKI